MILNDVVWISQSVVEFNYRYSWYLSQTFGIDFHRCATDELWVILLVKWYQNDILIFICSLQKEYRARPKYDVLLQDPFIVSYSQAMCDISPFVQAMLDLNPV